MNIGKKSIVYNGKKYFIKDLIRFKRDVNLSHFFEDGNIQDLDTGKTYMISHIEDLYKSKYKEFLDKGDILGYNKKTQVKKSTLDNDLNSLKQSELESKFNDGEMSIEDLKELIILKYGEKYKVCISYENYIKINHKIPDLTDAELGKFYKILSKLSHKANTLLTKKDIRSNPVTKNDLCELLNIDIKPTERYLKKLKDKGIIKQVNIGVKTHLMINPIYAFNGNIIGSYTYTYFKDDLDEVADIPDELKLLWEYEFVNSTIEVG